MMEKRTKSGARRRTALALTTVLGALFLVAVVAWEADRGDQAVAVSGTVLDESGSPLEGAEVALFPVPTVARRMALLLEGAEPVAVTRTVTDARGRYRLEAPHEGFWSVRAAAQDRLTKQTLLDPLLSPPPGAPRRALELEPVALPRDVGLLVTVVDEQARAVPGALVKLHGRDLGKGEDPRRVRAWHAERRIAVADARGRVRFQASAFGDGWVRAWTGTRAGGRSLDGTGGSASLRLVLDRQPYRRIQVVGPDGQPVEGALVWARLDPIGRSGRDGTIVVQTLEKSSVTVRAATEDGLTASLRLGAARGQDADAAAEPVALFLERPPVVSGRVVSETGHSPSPGPLVVPEAFVWSSGNPGGAVRTAPDGTYRLSLSPGQRELRATASGMTLVKRTLDHDSGGALRDMIVELRFAGWISGLTVDETGRPLAGVRVSASREPLGGVWRPTDTAWTGPAGDYLLRGLEADTPYRVQAFREGRAPAEERIVLSSPRKAAERARRTGVQIVLPSPRGVVGRVIDRSGEPVAGAAVSLIAEDQLRDDNLWVFVGDQTRRTDDAGRFELENMRPVKALLAVVDPDHALFYRELAIPEGGGETDVGDVVLEPEGVVRGRVLNVRGEPVQGALVSEAEFSVAAKLRQILFRRRERQATVGAVPTAADGTFELDRFLPNETVALRVSAEGLVSQQVVTEPKPRDARRASVEVTLQPTGRLRGRVLDADGQPVFRATVLPDNSDPEAGRFQGVATDREGRFAIDIVQPGRLVLVAEAKGYARSLPVAVSYPD